MDTSKRPSRPAPTTPVRRTTPIVQTGRKPAARPTVPSPPVGWGALETPPDGVIPRPVAHRPASSNGAPKPTAKRSYAKYWIAGGVGGTALLVVIILASGWLSSSKDAAPSSGFGAAAPQEPTAGKKASAGTPPNAPVAGRSPFLVNLLNAKVEAAHMGKEIRQAWESGNQLLAQQAEQAINSRLQQLVGQRVHYDIPVRFVRNDGFIEFKCSWRELELLLLPGEASNDSFNLFSAATLSAKAIPAQRLMALSQDEELVVEATISQARVVPSGAIKLLLTRARIIPE